MTNLGVHSNWGTEHELETPVDPIADDGAAVLAHKYGRGHKYGTTKEISIDFEVIPGVGPACYFCVITDQFAEYGVEFSPHVYMTDVTDYEAPGLDSHHALSPNNRAANPIHVFDARFTSHPLVVQFEVTTGEQAPPWVMTAFASDGSDVTVLRDATTYVTRHGFTFRREYVTVASKNRIALINFDMSSATNYLYYMDNLVISHNMKTGKSHKPKGRDGKRWGRRR